MPSMRDLEDFYGAMRAAGLLEPAHPPLTEAEAQRVALWRSSHLLAMALLAQAAAPDLAIDGTLGPDALYGALSRAIDLEAGAVFDLAELLDALEGLDPGYRSRAPYLAHEADRQRYRRRLQDALAAALRAHPWRQAGPRSKFERRHVFGARLPRRPG